MKTPIKPIKNYETTHENTNKTNNNYETTLIKTMKNSWKHQQHQSKQRTKNKMQPTNPNAHTYVDGTDVETHGYAVT